MCFAMKFESQGTAKARSGTDCVVSGTLQLGLQHGLPPFSPVDDAGCFTAEAGAEFQGLAVLDDGNDAVIKALQRAGALLKVPTRRTFHQHVTHSADLSYDCLFHHEALSASRRLWWP